MLPPRRYLAASTAAAALPASAPWTALVDTEASRYRGYSIGSVLGMCRCSREPQAACGRAAGPPGIPPRPADPRTHQHRGCCPISVLAPGWRTSSANGKASGSAGGECNEGASRPFFRPPFLSPGCPGGVGDGEIGSTATRVAPPRTKPS